MKSLVMIFGLLLCVSVFGGEKKRMDRSPASIIKARKAQEVARSKQRKQYLAMALARSTRTRYHLISALVKTLPRNTKQALRDLASSKRVDLRKPMKIEVFANLDFQVGDLKSKFVWNAKKKMYYYQNKPVAFDASASPRENFKKLQVSLRGKSAWVDLLVPPAYAQDMNEVIYDLSVLLALRNGDEQQVINELGSAALMPEEGMVRLAQQNKFLRMECTMGAHSAEARIYLGDGSPEGTQVLIAEDLGQGEINHYIEQNGVRTEQTGVSDSAAPYLSQNIFREVCENMTAVEVQEYSEGLWYFGNETNSTY